MQRNVSCFQVQCLLSFCLSLLSATDTGFCCLGISITRWFLHTDFYTQAPNFYILISGCSATTFALHSGSGICSRSAILPGSETAACCRVVPILPPLPTSWGGGAS